MLESSKRKFVRWLDPKLEKYREHKPIPPYMPDTLADFIELLKRTPKNVLNKTDRAKIAAVMTFAERTVKDLMVGKDEMVFVGSEDVMGPLTVDKLYQSGYTHFPVLNKKERIVGILHTEAFNSLEIKETDKAEKYMSRSVLYLHESDSLDFMISEAHRTGGVFFLVQDDHNDLSGFVTVDHLLNYLLGK